MHQFKIIYTDYNEKGALTSSTHVWYGDIPEQAQVKFDELNRQYRTYTNEETGETKQYKAYQVRLYTAAYKQIAEPEELFAQFRI